MRLHSLWTLARNPALVTCLLVTMGACDSGTSTSTAPSAGATATASTRIAPRAPDNSPTATSAATPSASASATPSSHATAAARATVSPPSTSTVPPPPPLPQASAAPGTSGSAGAASKWDCGNKGQKACPMQGWMKGVMARAVASGDAEKIASALNTIAAKPVPGYGEWVGLASEGAAKARAGDISGAKLSCKKCHALYQKKYKTTMRDRPW